MKKLLVVLVLVVMASCQRMPSKMNKNAKMKKSHHGMIHQYQHKPINHSLMQSFK